MLRCDYGRILKTTNAGYNWNQDSTYLKYDIPIGVFWYIDALDSNNVAVSGSGGKILKSTNGGASWIQQNGFKKTLNSIYFTDANIGYSVGDSGKILKTTDAGDNWNELQSGTTKRIKINIFCKPNYGLFSWRYRNNNNDNKCREYIGQIKTAELRIILTPCIF